MKKKNILALLCGLFLVWGLFVSSNVNAANVLSTLCKSATAKNSTVCQDSSTNGQPVSNPFSSTIKTVVNVFSVVLGIAAIIVILISSLRMIVAGGDPQTINSSRNAILYALIGLFVAISAGAIAHII